MGKWHGRTTWKLLRMQCPVDRIQYDLPLVEGYIVVDSRDISKACGIALSSLFFAVGNSGMWR